MKPRRPKPIKIGDVEFEIEVEAEKFVVIGISDPPNIDGLDFIIRNKQIRRLANWFTRLADWVEK